MTAQELLTSLSSVPSVAIVFFFVLAAVLIAELWYLRPKRRLPPIPPPRGGIAPPLPGQPAAPSSPVSLPFEPTGFSPLSQKQIYLVGFLVFLLVVIPLAVFLFKRTQETKEAVTLLPSPTAVVRETASPTRTPFSLPTPTLTPWPEGATPSATPRELAGGVLTTPTPTPTPTPTRKPTASPTPTPEWKPKGGAVSPTPTSFPKTERPEELPDASFSEQAIFLALIGLPALLVGVGEIGRKLKE